MYILKYIHNGRDSSHNNRPVDMENEPEIDIFEDRLFHSFTAPA